LRISRWFANRDIGEDDGDFFRLEIRESALHDDLILEELDSDQSAPWWEEVTFRVADHVTPGPAVELKVSAADGPAEGNIVEAAIDEIVFWEPFCEVYDPAPNPVDSLTVELAGEDVVLEWNRPGLDPGHGETEQYRVYRSETPSGGFALLDVIEDPSPSVGFIDSGAAAGPPVLYYEVIANNAAGDSDPLP
jgi:hypothetical protein